MHDQWQNTTEPPLPPPSEPPEGPPSIPPPPLPAPLPAPAPPPLESSSAEQALCLEDIRNALVATKAAKASPRLIANGETSLREAEAAAAEAQRNLLCAQKGGDLKDFRNAVEAAKAAKVSHEIIPAETEASSREAVMKAEARRKLLCAQESGNLEDIQNALVATKAAKASPRLIANGEISLREAEAAEEAKTNLACAQESRDVERIRNALEAAKTANVATSIIEEGESSLREVEAATAEVERKFKLAKNSDELDRYGEAFDEAKVAGVSHEIIAKTEAALKAAEAKEKDALKTMLLLKTKGELKAIALEIGIAVDTINNSLLHENASERIYDLILNHSKVITRTIDASDIGTDKLRVSCRRGFQKDQRVILRSAAGVEVNKIGDAQDGGGEELALHDNITLRHEKDAVVAHAPITKEMTDAIQAHSYTYEDACNALGQKASVEEAIKWLDEAGQSDLDKQLRLSSGYKVQAFTFKETNVMCHMLKVPKAETSVEKVIDNMLKLPGLKPPGLTILMSSRDIGKVGRVDVDDSDTEQLPAVVEASARVRSNTMEISKKVTQQFHNRLDLPKDKLAAAVVHRWQTRTNSVTSGSQNDADGAQVVYNIGDAVRAKRRKLDGGRKWHPGVITEAANHIYTVSWPCKNCGLAGKADNLCDVEGCGCGESENDIEANDIKKEVDGFFQILHRPLEDGQATQQLPDDLVNNQNKKQWFTDGQGNSERIRQSVQESIEKSKNRQTREVCPVEELTATGEKQKQTFYPLNLPLSAIVQGKMIYRRKMKENSTENGRQSESTSVLEASKEKDGSWQKYLSVGTAPANWWVWHLTRDHPKHWWMKLNHGYHWAQRDQCEGGASKQNLHATCKRWEDEVIDLVIDHSCVKEVQWEDVKHLPEMSISRSLLTSAHGCSSGFGPPSYILTKFQFALEKSNVDEFALQKAKVQKQRRRKRRSSNPLMCCCSCSTRDQSRVSTHPESLDGLPGPCLSTMATWDEANREFRQAVQEVAYGVCLTASEIEGWLLSRNPVFYEDRTASTHVSGTALIEGHTKMKGLSSKAASCVHVGFSSYTEDISKMMINRFSPVAGERHGDPHTTNTANLSARVKCDLPGPADTLEDAEQRNINPYITHLIIMSDVMRHAVMTQIMDSAPHVYVVMGGWNDRADRELTIDRTYRTIARGAAVAALKYTGRMADYVARLKVDRFDRKPIRVPSGLMEGMERLLLFDAIRDSANNIVDKLSLASTSLSQQTRELNFEQIEKSRLKDAWQQQQTFKKNASMNKAAGRSMHFAIMACGILTTMFAVLYSLKDVESAGKNYFIDPKGPIIHYFKWGSSVLPLVSALLVKIISHFNQAKKWGLLRAASAKMQSEIYKYRCRIGQYAPRNGVSSLVKPAKKLDKNGTLPIAAASEKTKNKSIGTREPQHVEKDEVDQKRDVQEAFSNSVCHIRQDILQSEIQAGAFSKLPAEWWEKHEHKLRKRSRWKKVRNFRGEQYDDETTEETRELEKLAMLGRSCLFCIPNPWTCLGSFLYIFCRCSLGSCSSQRRKCGKRFKRCCLSYCCDKDGCCSHCCNWQGKFKSCREWLCGNESDSSSEEEGASRLNYDNGIDMITGEDYVKFRLRPMQRKMAVKAQQLRTVANWINTFSFSMTMVSALLGLLGLQIYMPITVALVASCESIMQFENTAARLSSLNSALMVLQTELSWWESLRLVVRRNREKKEALVEVTENAIVQATLAWTNVFNKVDHKSIESRAVEDKKEP